MTVALGIPLSTQVSAFSPLLAWCMTQVRPGWIKSAWNIPPLPKSNCSRTLLMILGAVAVASVSIGMLGSRL